MTVEPVSIPLARPRVKERACLRYWNSGPTAADLSVGCSGRGMLVTAATLRQFQLLRGALAAPAKKSGVA